MTVFAFIFGLVGLVIILCFCLQWIVLPIAVSQRGGLTRRWLWLIGVLALPLLYIAAIQAGHLRSPTWKGWLVRCVFAGAISLGIFWFSKTHWANSDEVFDFKGNLVSFFTSEVGYVEGRTVRRLDGNGVIFGPQAFTSAYKVASLAVLAGALQFYGPLIKSFVLTIAASVCSFVAIILTEAWLIESAGTNTPDIVK